jgi:hypothetical protein
MPVPDVKSGDLTSSTYTRNEGIGLRMTWVKNEGITLVGFL